MTEAPASICDVLPAAAALLGAAGADDHLGLLGELGPCRQVVVVLVDGMGLHLLPRLAPHAPFLAAVLEGNVGSLHAARSVFPSTTPTNLVSLGTGVEAGAHGVLGFTVNVPDTTRVLTHVVWRDDPPPSSWQPVPTWFERLATAGVPCAAVLPAAFEHGGLTAAAYRGTSFVPVPAGSTRPVASVPTIVSALGRARLVVGYTEVLDTAAHRFGITSDEWLAAAGEVDALLSALAGRLPPGTALLVTADHGGLDVPPDRRVDLDTEPALAAGVTVVAGEPRVRYLHTLAGARDDVVATWRGSLGDRVSVLTRDEAIDDGWFGPVRPDHAARIGDVVVVCEDDTAILATAHEPAAVSELVGFHGARRPEEVEIPIIAVASGS